MPIYDYKCKNCGFIQEEIHSSKDVTNDENDISFSVVCLNCKEKGTMKRIIGNPLIATYNMASPEEKKEMLKKRSREHFKKHIEDKFHQLNKKVF